MVLVSHLSCWTIAFFFFLNKFGVQNLDSGPGFPTDSLYGQLLFTLEEKPLGNGITVILSILRAPPYRDLNPFYVKKQQQPESFLMHISK